MNESLLELNKICFSVAEREMPIVKNVSFAVENNDFLVLLGSNGSGKSSLIKLINGVYQLTAGQIKLQNKLLKNYKQRDLAKEIITITQDVNDSLFLDMTIAENGVLAEMRSQKMFVGISKAKQAARFKEYLAKFSIKLSKHIDAKVGSLSGGEKQILVLALCLRYPPKLLLLDEHTSALDPKTAAFIMEKTLTAISERKIACIMTTHNLDFALHYGNKLLALKEGELVYKADSSEKANISRAELLVRCY
jgi:putative ABC transport system ATP-binding protein